MMASGSRLIIPRLREVEAMLFNRPMFGSEIVMENLPNDLGGRVQGNQGS